MNLYCVVYTHLDLDCYVTVVIATTDYFNAEVAANGRARPNERCKVYSISYECSMDEFLETGHRALTWI